jgi:hypothetical protein
MRSTSSGGCATAASGNAASPTPEPPPAGPSAGEATAAAWPEEPGSPVATGSGAAGRAAARRTGRGGASRFARSGSSLRDAGSGTDGGGAGTAGAGTTADAGGAGATGAETAAGGAGAGSTHTTCTGTSVWRRASIATPTIWSWKTASAIA